MKRCTQCLMPETARNIAFDENGVCLACTRAATAKTRFDELEAVAKEYRRSGGSYDCLIPVSGGKDSFFQVYWMKEKLGMNPLLVTVTDEFCHTKAGEHNAKQIGDAFRCDTIQLRLNPQMVRETTRWGFENIGSTNWAIDMAIYAWPLRMAIKMGIQLVVYGENVEWEYGCKTGVDTPSALGQIENSVVNTTQTPYLSEFEANCLKYPTVEEMSAADLKPIYLSYFTGWDGMKNANVAKIYGFRGLQGEWDRAGYVDDFWQVDSVGYLMNYYLKYAKYGYGKATDVASHLIRYGHLTRIEAAGLVHWKEGVLDQRILDDFLRFAGYSDKEFWSIIDKWRNKDLFSPINGFLVLKNEHRL
jgi:N-acetyl sugar amidotransferase